MWDEWRTIVGVVATSKYHALAESPQPYFYVPLRQTFRASTDIAVHVRGDGDLGTLGGEVRSALQALDPRLPPPLMTTLAEYIGASYFAQRVASMLLGVLAALALLLASVGLYSLIAYGVAARRQEIGVRIALGATGGDILRMIVGQGVRTTAIGVAAGIGLALLSARALATLLFGVTPADVPTVIASAVVLGGVALAASYVPARSATKIEPSEALRAE
jgi:ABC-type antimicrobial peptide transport system permease subunit